MYSESQPVFDFSAHLDVDNCDNRRFVGRFTDSPGFTILATGITLSEVADSLVFRSYVRLRTGFELDRLLSRRETG